MDFMEEHFDDEEDHIMEDGEEDSKDAGDGKKGSRQSRKRTKTGCLTCRRRRIKCGEERPVCGNCIKSKRQCEGYNQRVVFKDPMNTWRGPGSNASPSIPRTSAAASASANRQRPVPANASFSDGIPDIKPTTFISVPRADGSMSKAHIPPCLSSQTLNTIDHSRPEMPGRTRSLPQAMSARKGSLGKQIDLSPTELQDSIERSYVQVGSELADPVSQPHPRITYNMSALLGLGSEPEAAPYPMKMPGSRQSFDGGRPAGSFSQDRNYKSDIGDVASDILLQSFQNSANWSVYSNQMSANGRDPLALGHVITSRALMNSWNHNFRDERDQELPKHQILQKTAEIDPMSVRRNSNGLHSPASQAFSTEAESSDKSTFVKTPVSKDDALEMEEDEIASDEYNDEPAADYYGQHQDDHLQQNDLGIIVAKQAMQEIHGYHVRTFNSIIESFGPGILTGYEPSVNSSPLNDPTSARIFIHFINVLGPSISQFERHPANPSLLLQGQPVPSSQHHLWTYTLPTLALKNKALLHAMLALSSFHIAKMQDGPLWPSLKHYQLAIRQVGKNVSLPTRRGHPETLAATLILGFYELMSAEHQKWSNHLLGAKHQLNEIDFRSSTRQIKALRRELGFIRTPHMQSDIGLGHLYDVHQAPIAAWEEEIDESLIKSIMGSSLQFDAFGAVIDGSEATGTYNEARVFSQAEIDIYECQRDLFWLFCKHDCFQSILGGNRLFMNYSRYSHCSPRAPIGRRDAIYGTYDHLVLLMARVADFAARDIKRKKLAVQLNGGRWKPPVGFGMADIPTPPLDERSVSPSSARPPTQSPPPPIPNFPGMFPDINQNQNQKPPRGFSPGEISHSSAESEGEVDFDAQTRAAELEWHEIRDAFRMLEDRFGPDFQPLGPEHSQPIETAFGPALQYRTYGITSIWVTFYFSLIVCHRAHPSMPPAAMMAAGICASETDFFAQQIGRAAAGIAPNAETATEVTTQVGSALIETSLGLFIAGIQYQDPSQRRWLIQRCRDTARLTSWQTALPIARGCEVAWVKVAEMGRGPPYTKVPEEQICAWKSEKRQMPHHQYDIFSPAEAKKAFTIQDRTHLALGLLSIDADLDIVDNT